MPRIRALVTAALLLAACRNESPPPAPPPAGGPEPPPAAAAAQDPAPAPKQTEEYRIVNPSLEPYPCGHLTILARDPETGDLGLVLLTGCPGGGGFMVAARAGAGLAVCGNYPDTTWPPRALELLAAGKRGDGLLQALLGEQPRPVAVQLGTMAADGSGDVYTGTNVRARDGASIEPDLILCGTGLVAPDVIDEAKQAFVAAAGLPLPERLLLALRPAVAIRERGSRTDAPGALMWSNRPVAAALIVLREGSGHDGRDDRLVDLRIDWSEDPLRALETAYANHLQAVLWPRLKLMQRDAADRDSPRYSATARWLARLRLRKGIGER
jgi:uncharacterized Ntn-hydrolase superfamily protein